MVKGFTLLIGLAVVMALALAAVFGSMSLANPAMAQNGPAAIEELKVSSVTNGTITISWKFIEGIEDAEYQARWAEATDPISSGTWTPGEGTGFDVTVGTAADGSMAAISGLNNGAEYNIELRTNDSVQGVGAVSMISGIPNHVPDGTSAVTAVSVDDEMPGQITVSWTYLNATNVPTDNVSMWQYRTAEYSEPSTVDPPTPDDYTDDTLEADSESDWMDLSGVTGEGTAEDPFMATVSGLEAKIYGFQVRAMNGLAIPADVTFGANGAAANTIMSAASPLPRLMLGEITAMAGDGYVRLSWARLADATGYSYLVKDGDLVVQASTEVAQTPLSTVTTTVMNLENGTEYTFEVTAAAATGDDATHRDSGMMMVMATPMAAVIDVVAGLPMFTQSSDDPGDSGNYDVKFQIDTDLGSAINTRNNDLIIEFHEDYGIPSSIRNTSVAITTQLGSARAVTFTPEDITVDGEKVLLSLGDMDERDDQFDYEIDPGEVINVHFRQSAGITTATEHGGYFLVEIVFGAYDDAYDEDAEKPKGLEVNVVRKLSLSEEDGGLGDVITATGKGFKNGTTLTVFVDKPVDHDDNDKTPDMPNGILELNEDVLCVANIGSDDVGKCEFTITHPTFLGGMNYVNAVDGRDQYAPKADTFVLDASIEAKPASGSPGESIVIQIVDFPKNRGISAIQISRDSRTINCVGNCSTDQNGAASFSIVIPNWVKSGTQDLRVTVNDEDDNPVRAGTTIDLAGPRVVSTPQTVVANQRVSLVGTGFSPNAEFGDDTDESRAVSKVSIGG